MAREKELYGHFVKYVREVEKLLFFYLCLNDLLTLFYLGVVWEASVWGMGGMPYPPIMLYINALVMKLHTNVPCSECSNPVKKLVYSRDFLLTSAEIKNSSSQDAEFASYFIVFCIYYFMLKVASGRRGNVALSSILSFVTGASEEPVLGFILQPSISFSSGETDDQVIYITSLFL